MATKFYKFSEKDFLNGRNILDLEEEGCYIIDDKIFFDDEAECISFTGKDNDGTVYEFCACINIPDDFDKQQITAGDLLNFPAEELNFWKQGDDE